MACFPPFCRFFIDFRALKNLCTFETESVLQKLPFLLLDATSAFQISSVCHSLSCPGSTPKPQQKIPRLNFPALQHLRSKNAPFSLFSKRLKCFALHFSGSVFRVWLPSSRLTHPITLKDSFNFQRSWASPFKAFLLICDRKEISFLSFAPALIFKTPADLEDVPQRFDPTDKAVPSLSYPED